MRSSVLSCEKEDHLFQKIFKNILLYLGLIDSSASAFVRFGCEIGKYLNEKKKQKNAGQLHPFQIPKNLIIKAGASKETLLRKQKCVHDAKKCFLKKIQSIFCFQDADFVSSTYVALGSKRGITWETLKKQ